jgi:hypothetical protein
MSCLPLPQLDQGHVIIQASFVDGQGKRCAEGTKLKLVVSLDGQAQEVVELEVDANGNGQASVVAMTHARVSAFSASSFDSWYLVCSDSSGVFVGDLQAGSIVKLNQLVVQDAVLLTTIEGCEYLNRWGNWISVRPANGEPQIRFSLQESSPIRVYADRFWSREFTICLERGQSIQETADLVPYGSSVTFAPRRAWVFGGRAEQPVELPTFKHASQLWGASMNAWVTSTNGTFEVDLTVELEDDEGESTSPSFLYINGSIPGPGVYSLNITGVCNCVHRKFVVTEPITNLNDIDLWEGWKPTTLKFVGAPEGKIVFEVLVPESGGTWREVRVGDDNQLAIIAPSGWSLSARIRVSGGYKHFGICSLTPLITIDSSTR